MDYKASGVDIDAGNEAVRRIRMLARSTFTAGVMSDIGSFGGLFRIDGLGSARRRALFGPRRLAAAIPSGGMRRILGSDAPPEDGVEERLVERRLELEAQAAELEDAIADLERREGLLRASRTSLERLLRLGTSDFDSREAELAELIRELTAREERLREDEADLTRRRCELGAVEL